MNNPETLIDTAALKMVLDFLGQKDSEAEDQSRVFAALEDGARKKHEEHKLRGMLSAQLQLLETLRSQLA